MRVEDIVRQVSDKVSKRVHAVRRMAVALVAAAVVRSGRLSTSAMGRSLIATTSPKHAIKRVDRLLGNPHWWAERMLFFAALADRLVGGWERPAILVDWTQTIGTDRALVAAVPIGGRALPIYLEVHPERKLGNAKVQRRFLHALRAILPAGCRPIIVTDAGFHGDFFRDVQDLGWDFVGRLRGTAKVVPMDGGAAVDKDYFYRRATKEPTDYGWVRLYARRPGPLARLVVVKSRRKPGRRPPARSSDEIAARKAGRDPWLLATSLSEDYDAAAVVHIYRLRMQIEETFRDAKNHRFGWSLRHAQTRSRERQTMLLLLAAVAMLAVTLVGLEAERRGLHRAYQANTVKRRVLSLFMLGAAVLHRNNHRLAGFAEIHRLAFRIGA